MASLHQWWKSGRFARCRQAASSVWATEGRGAPRMQARIVHSAACASSVAGGLTEQERDPHRDNDVAHSAEPTRRDFLYIATGAVAAVGAAGALVPLIAQMNPDASTIAAGAPIEVDLTPIAEGQVIKVFWRGKPIYINHRTKKQIEEAENVDVAKLPDPQPNSARVKPGHANGRC